MFSDGYNEFQTLDELYSSDKSCFQVMPEMIVLALRLDKKYGKPIGSGLTRVTWNTHKGHVIKLPRCEKGSMDNEWESSISMVQDKLEDEGYAKTKSSLFNDYVVIMAEFITEATLDDVKNKFGIIPDWIYSIDCIQVGFNKKGYLKAYDFAL